jgi:hypothetical protein
VNCVPARRQGRRVHRHQVRSVLCPAHLARHTVKASAQQNSVTGCLNRTLEEFLVAMLNGARLPERFWGEGLNYLCHVIVGSPLSSVPAGTTLYEMVHKRTLDYSPLRLFNCWAWVHIQCKECKSLQDHAKPCVFLGCPKDLKGWKLWEPSANSERSVCDAYSVRRVWSGRRRCENKRRYDKYNYAPGAAGDGVRTSADSATRRLAPGLCTRARVTCYKVRKHTMRATGAPVHAESMLPQAPTPTASSLSSATSCGTKTSSPACRTSLTSHPQALQSSRQA